MNTVSKAHDKSIKTFSDAEQIFNADYSILQVMVKPDAEVEV